MALVYLNHLGFNNSNAQLTRSLYFLVHTPLFIATHKAVPRQRTNNRKEDPVHPPSSVNEQNQLDLIVERVAAAMFNQHNNYTTWANLRNPKIKQTFRSYATTAINTMFAPKGK